MEAMSDGLPVVGGPCDGATMPAWGPTGYHYEFNGKHYWYFRQGGKWTLAVVNDGAVPKRPPHDATSTTSGRKLSKSDNFANFD